MMGAISALPHPVFLRSRLEHEDCSGNCAEPCLKCRDFRRDLEQKILSLSGTLIKTDFDPRATIVLSSRITRSDKLLQVLAAGLWIVHPTYVTDSFAAGKWLVPDQYEYTMELVSKLNIETTDEQKELIQACRMRRLSKEAKIAAALARGATSSGLPFEGWNVLFMVSDNAKLQQYVSLLKAGGAQAVHTGEVGNVLSHQQGNAVTHVVVDMLGQTLPVSIPRSAIVIAGISVARSITAGEEIGSTITRSSEEYEVKTRLMEEIVNDHIENLLDPDSCESLLRSVRIFCQTGRLPKARTVEFIVKNVLPTQSEQLVPCVSVLENLKTLHPPHRTSKAWAPGRDYATNLPSDQPNEMDRFSGKRSYSNISASRRDSSSLGIDGEEKGPSDWLFLKMAIEYALAQDQALGWTEKIFGDDHSGKHKWVQTLTGEGCLASVEYMVSVLDACASASDEAAAKSETMEIDGNATVKADGLAVANAGLTMAMLKEAKETTEAALRDTLEWIRLCIAMECKRADAADGMSKPDAEEDTKSSSYTPPVDAQGFPVTTRLAHDHQQILLTQLQTLASLIINASSATSAPAQVTWLKKCYTALETADHKARFLDTIVCNSLRIAECKKDAISMLLLTDFDKQSIPQDIVCLTGSNTKPSLFQIVGCYFFLRPKRKNSGSKELKKVYKDGKVDSLDNHTDVALAWMNRNLQRLQAMETQWHKDWTKSSEELLLLLLHYSNAYLYIKGPPRVKPVAPKVLDDAPLQATNKMDDCVMATELLTIPGTTKPIPTDSQTQSTQRIDECVGGMRSRMPPSARIDALCQTLSFMLQSG